MPYSKVSIALLFFSLHRCLTSEADFTYLDHFCLNTATFTNDSAYQANLNHLFSLLSSNATSTNGFYGAPAGQDPDTVYGLFLCRGDVTTAICNNCITSAIKDVGQRCPIEKEAIIWYDKCLIRYSSRQFFFTMDVWPSVSMKDGQNITDRGHFNDLLTVLMNDIATRAANAPSGAKKFATKEEKFWGVQKLYSLVQCTPDLSNSDCNSCLVEAIAILPLCCLGKEGGTVLFPSCNIRYAVNPFYNQTVAAKRAPSPVVLLPSSPDIVLQAPMPAALFPPTSGKGQISSWTIVTIIVPTIGFVVVLFTLWSCFRSSKRRGKHNTSKEENEMTNEQSLQFDFCTIEDATNNFSDDNKIGVGGFGNVYRGTLPNGPEIAVKRLSRSSGQGAKEFKNEVLLIARLEHRNLVRLLGFCLEEKEKILIYEFVPNKSLDYFLFDAEKQGQLDWSKRYNIIGGTARGLLYLHEDSRLKIIHRDLKAGNILLDGDMNPKISDFGLARIIAVDQNQGSTNRIVGTYGYMPPEYAMRGEFSVKSDVFSFGVIILEIICGRKNSSFYHPNHAENLLSYAWRHWKDGTSLEIMDPTLSDSYLRNQVIRCFQIGLLCVQENSAARPTMATVLFMLNSSSVILPSPQQPAFFFGRGTESNMPIMELEADQSISKLRPSSVNEVSITELYPR